MTNKQYVLETLPLSYLRRENGLCRILHPLVRGTYISGPHKYPASAWAQAADNLRNHRKLTLGELA